MNDFDQICLTFYQNMFRDDYLIKLTDLAYEYCHNPVMVMDYTHHVLSYSPESLNENPLWNELITKFISKDIINHDYFHENMRKVTESKEPVFIEWEGFNYILAPIFSRDTFAGFVALYLMNENYTQEDKMLIKIFADILSIRFERFIVESADEEYSQNHILLDLLNNQISDEKTLCRRISNRNWSYTMPFRIIAIDITNENKGYSHYRKNIIRKNWPNNNTLIYKNALIILEQDASNKSSLLTWLSQDKNTLIGVSDIFDNLLDIHHYLNQANLAIYYGKKHINYYHQYQFKDLINQIQQISYIETYFDINYQILKQEDINLIETIITYINCNMNLVDSAKALKVHRNTIVYRLKKINELCPNLLKQPEALFHFRLSYYLDK